MKINQDDEMRIAEIINDNLIKLRAEWMGIEFSEEFEDEFGDDCREWSLTRAIEISAELNKIF